MLSRQRIIDVLGDQVVLVWERSPGYRNHLATALADVIRVQDEGVSERARRDRVRKIVESLVTKVLSRRRAD